MIITSCVIGEVGFENVLNVSCVGRVDFAVFRSEKPEGWGLSGDLGLVVVESGEV